MKPKALVWLFLLSVLALHAADITGKWSGKVPTRDGGERDVVFTFKQDGENLAGSMTGREIETHFSGGKVDGNNINFTVTVGGDVKIIYKGVLSGSEIKFTREREGSGRPREFTVKRAES